MVSVYTRMYSPFLLFIRFQRKVALFKVPEMPFGSIRLSVFAQLFFVPTSCLLSGVLHVLLGSTPLVSSHQHKHVNLHM